MVAASLIVEVALGKGPNDTGLVDGDYTDLSDRVLGFTMDRGRDDRTQSFDPGTCTLILDNEDRELDPMRAGSAVDLTADLGLPLCPIRISVTYDGSDHRVFTGYIGPEPWRPLPNEVDGKPAVRLDAMDRMAYLASLSLPESVFAAVVKDMQPDWWIRGLAPGTLSAGYAATLVDYSGNGYDATLSSSVFGASIYAVDSMVPGSDDSAMTVQTGVSGYSDETALTGAQANVTMGCVWRGTTAAGDQEIIRQRNMTGSVVRWRLHCTTAGDLVAIIYDTGGVATDFVAAPANPDPDSSGRWDDDKNHLVFVRVEGGTRLRVYADGETASVTASIPATVAGRPIFGGALKTASFDEVMLFQRSVTLADLDVLYGVFTQTVDPYDGDAVDVRSGFWWDLTSHPQGSNLEVHQDFATGRFVHGIRDIPGSLADALQELATSFQGTTWADRSGVVRVRLDPALDNGTEHDDDYILPQALLTDDPDATDTIPVVRRTMPEFTGVRLDRVFNLYRVTWKGNTAEYRDDASIARYGERVLAWTSLAYAEIDGTADVIEDAWLTVQGAPTWEIEPVTVFPLIDPGAADWVFPVLELEQKVTFQWVDGGYLYSTDLQVQREAWVWERDRLEVAVTLGMSRNGAPTVTSSTFSGDAIVLGTEADDVLTTETDIDLGANI